MRVFVAGATGVIGRRLVPMLVDVGHDVTGMTRHEQKTEALRAQGATPIVCDVFDVERLRSVVAEAKPEIVIHQLTDLPSTIDPRHFEKQAVGNNRVRTEGTRNLLEAAEAAGVRRVVAQSIAFAYGRGGGWVKTEDDPLEGDPPAAFRRSVDALHTLESAVTGYREGVVLRYGLFYGPGTASAADGSLAEQVRRRRFPVVGDGAGMGSFIHVDDAASATVVSLGGPAGIYNIADDDPAPMREWLPAYAQALGAPKPRRVPVWLAKLVAGEFAVYLATQARGASNAKAKRDLGWTPRFPSWREGFPAALAG